MDASLIDSITSLVRAADAKHLDNLPLFVEHDGEFKSLENLHGSRFSPRGIFKTNRVKSLGLYVNERISSGIPKEDVNVFVDPAAMRAQLWFDNFSGDGQGHARDRAVCELKRTAAFEALMQAHGKKFNQKEMVSWLIDWNANIEGAKQLITAVRNIKVTTVSEAKSNITPMAANRSLMETVEAKAAGEVALPETILFDCEPYLGFGISKFSLGVQAITDDDKIVFALRIESLESRQELLSDQFVLLIEAAVGVAPHVGTFDPS